MILNGMALIGAGSYRWSKKIEETIEEYGYAWLDWSYGLRGQKSEKIREQINKNGYFYLYLYPSSNKPIKNKLKIVTINFGHGPTSHPDPETQVPDSGDTAYCWMKAIEFINLSETRFLESFSHFYEPERSVPPSGLRNGFQPILDGSQKDLIDDDGSSMEDDLFHVESRCIFPEEEHLREFLVENWENLSVHRERDLDIYEDERERLGVEYPLDLNGRRWYIDILARNRITGELVVIELKKGRATSQALAQIQKYMGFLSEHLPNNGLRGLIIGTSMDDSLRYAISQSPNVEFLSYDAKVELISSQVPQ